MLQQTQAATVIAYFERFMEKFPTVRALASASEDEVLALWSGLGYYARARNLHRAAREVVARHGARFPTTFEALLELPGVGRSTAAAIAAFAGGERRAILDGNVRRLLARHAGISGDPSRSAVLARLWSEAEARLPPRAIERYTQGMMDLGAGVCLARRPACASCPVAADCFARLENRIAEIPVPRRRKAPERRRITMLAIVSRGEVLLEKRRSTGIWGGLWSLPEAAVWERPEAVLAREWGLRAERVEPLSAFEHAFTHFKLEVAPWRVDLRKRARIAPGKAAAWRSLRDLEAVALPAPVRRLLEAIASEPLTRARLPARAPAKGVLS